MIFRFEYSILVKVMQFHGIQIILGYLYEDKIILTFNYKDGSKTITLEEVEGSDLSVLGA